MPARKKFIWSERLTSRPLQHLGFWVLSGYVLYRIFAYSPETRLTDWLYTGFFHLALFAVVYLNTTFLIPRFLQAGRYVAYVLGVIGSWSIGLGIHWITFQWLTDQVLSGYFFISYYRWWEIGQFLVAYWALSTLLKLSKSWFRLRKQEKRIQQLQQEKIQAELLALKTQLDPHALFNSLNSIYALALEQDRRTPDAILRLSENMRYMLYDSQTLTIPLEREVGHLENYLLLQRMRHEDQVDVQFIQQGAIKEIVLPPLLLLPLVENAFKHGQPTLQGLFYIHIELTVNDRQLEFRVKNSRNTSNPKADKPQSASGGLGLVNLRRRLDLLYAGQAQLQQVWSAEEFLTTLTIQRKCLIPA